MKKLAAVLLCATLSATLFAATHSGFGLDAFNRAVSTAAKGNVVFSPLSFEIDSVIFSEACDALTRAKFAETMGVLNGLESVYQPLHAALEKADGKMSYLHARAFCLPDERKTHPAYRQWMQKTFAAEAFSFGFRKGAECWFKARMDGEMEDFAIPDNAASAGRYSFFDLVSFRCSWKEPFPTNNTRDIKFQLADGSTRAIPAMCDLRIVDIWNQKNISILRVPMEDSASFFAILPRQGLTVRDVRGELNSVTIVNIVAGMRSITEDGSFHGPAAVVIPKIDIVSESDLKMPFGYFKFPLSSMERMESEIRSKYIRQRVRVQIDEKGLDDAAVGSKSDEQIVNASPETVRFVLNRPFLFFVIHENTATMPIVGQFMGR